MKIKVKVSCDDRAWIGGPDEVIRKARDELILWRLGRRAGRSKSAQKGRERGDQD